MSIKESSEKPEISAFTLGRQIGEGNFSRIVVATHKDSHEVFALKVIEKQRVKRLRIRHPNIFNEINMEKDVLNKLRHANIIRLYHTFQDQENLYFLIEYLEGGELLSQLVHDGRQIGLHQGLAQFYLADIVNAMDFMHTNNVVHRDLKPENMVVCSRNHHLKLIDFGTAKNLEDTTLNGPNFVGTPEYMSPETIDNQPVGVASDLWALGCIVFQLLTGETPFSGGSAYLTFLKVQDGRFILPEYLSDDAKDLITKLLQKDPTMRLGASGNGISDIKAHPFFNGIDFDTHLQAPRPLIQFADESIFSLIADIAAIEKGRDNGKPLDFSSDSAQERINSLSSQDRSMLMHLLKRKQLLHLPGVYPRFFSSPSRGRCLYASQGSYIGYSHDLQNQWSDAFSFVQLAGPRLGRSAAADENDSKGGSTWTTEVSAFRKAIAAINKQLPSFVVICGEFVNAEPGSEFYEAQISAFQELLGEIRPEIRLVFVAGANAFGSTLDDQSITNYEAHFGDQYFSFWYGGIKFIVMNSSLLEQNDERMLVQEDWLSKELENGKLCARGTVVFSFHALDAATSSDANNGSDIATLSSTQKRYYDLILNAQTCLLVTAQSKEDSVQSIAKQVSDDEQNKCDVVHCRSPWSIVRDQPAAVCHVANVSQTGLTMEQLAIADGDRLDAVGAEMKASACPEDADEVLAAEAVNLEITS